MVYIAIFSVLICFLRIFRAKIEPEGKHENNCSTYISFTLLTFASSYLILVSNSVISCFCLQSSDSNYCLSEIQFLNSYKKPGKYLFKTSSSIALYWLYLCLYTVLLNILASLFSACSPEPKFWEVNFIFSLVIFSFAIINLDLKKSFDKSDASLPTS